MVRFCHEAACTSRSLGTVRRVARRTKIVATIGSASADEDTLADMIRAGMDVARFSLAHTPLQDALERHRRVRRVASELNANVATMIDLPGPKSRIGRVQRGGVHLAQGAVVALGVGDAESSAELINIDAPHLIDDCKVGDEITFGGGNVIVAVEAIGGKTLSARVVSGGHLFGRAGVYIPFGSVEDRVPSDLDREYLAAFLDEDVDIVAASVNSGVDVRELGLEPHPRGPMLVAKIETLEAVNDLDSILEEAGAIIVARSGLGLESPLEELPHIQKSVTRNCIAGGRPVITAGQMLDSMITAPSPTRAEATDIANAVFDGTSALMLSAETAIGAHPALVVANMARIAETADEQFDHDEWRTQVATLRMADSEHSHTAITDAMTIAAAQAIEATHVKAVICVSETGFTARSMARFRPRTKILGFSANERTVRQLALSWGVTPMLLEGSSPDYVDRVRVAVNLAKRAGHVATGDLVGVVAGIASSARATDTFRLVRVH
jgi:pyruvate kinase